MIGLIFVVAVMNVALGFGLAVLLGKGPGWPQALEWFNLRGKNGQQPAGQ